MLHPSSCPSRQLDTIDIPQTLPRYTFSLHQFRQLGAKTFGSASPPCMTACSSKASSRLIASIVSSLCVIAIVSAPQIKSIHLSFQSYHIDRITRAWPSQFHLFSTSRSAPFGVAFSFFSVASLIIVFSSQVDGNTILLTTTVLAA